MSDHNVIVNIDAPTLNKLITYLSQVKSLCDKLSLIGSVRLRSSVEVTISKSDNSIEDLLNSGTLDYLSVPIFFNEIEQVVPIKVYYKSSKLLPRSLLIDRSNSTNIGKVIDEVYSTLQMLGVDLSRIDFSTYMKRGVIRGT